MYGGKTSFYWTEIFEERDASDYTCPVVELPDKCPEPHFRNDTISVGLHDYFAFGFPVSLYQCRQFSCTGVFNVLHSYNVKLVKFVPIDFSRCICSVCRMIVDNNDLEFLRRVLDLRQGIQTPPDIIFLVPGRDDYRNNRFPVECYHLRTADGREIDLLLETEAGFIPIEIKMAERVSPADARHLRNLSEILDKPVLHALVLSNDGQIKKLAEGITALPVAWALA